MTSAIWLKTREVSQLTGLSVQTIYRLVEADEIPHMRPWGNGRGPIQYRKDLIMKWLEKRSHLPPEMDPVERPPSEAAADHSDN